VPADENLMFLCCREFQVLFKDVSGMKHLHVICKS